MKTQREKAVSSLNLAQNSIVLDVACGVGFNFEFIENRIGGAGRIVGLELSPKTAELATKLVAKRHWTNVEVVNMSIMDYQPGTSFDAVVCTQAMEIMPAKAVDKIFQLLGPQGRFAMIGMKLSSRIPFKLLNPLIEQFAKSGGIDIHRDVYRDIESRCDRVCYQEYLGGFSYILSTTKSSSTQTIART